MSAEEPLTAPVPTPVPGRRSRRSLAIAISLALVLALEVAGRAQPSRPGWIDELHPLLGAAPADSFARRADDDPWADFRGRRFSRRRGAAERYLVLGGAAAERALGELERRLAGEVVLAARAGFGSPQEAILAARFAPVLGATTLIAIDGEELAAPARPAGWTPEWDWHEAAVASPIGEWLARYSGLARLVFVRPVASPGSLDELRRRYVRGVRSVMALATARRTPLLWVFEPGPELDPARPDGIYRELSALAASYHEKGGDVRAFRGTAELVRGLDGK